MINLNDKLTESEEQLLTNSGYESDRTGAKARLFIEAARNILYLLPKVHEVGGSNSIKKERDTESLQKEIENAQGFLSGCTASGSTGFVFCQMSTNGKYDE